ncbi:L,D-transpeptidase family protein [Hahella sp. HN01]|uniref:L,D-transpeptidase family protein n=1 Tax=Hahella sp. HN01 TaxID=2847262 RepID=UPI001C1EC94F|nr:L,D-transpeptidase family protein [Hahella sp. HN01]MBU6950476.1 L,D-transpeptidase family protein [Hahella sp. HN01]
MKLKAALIGLVGAVSIQALSGSAGALELTWNPKQDIVGREHRLVAKKEYTFVDLGEQYNFGFNELVSANPGVDAWLPAEGDEIVIPGRFILPPGLRNGILINLAEYRLYYFQPDKKRLYTVPIGIGTVDFPTPIMDTKIVTRMKNPTWYPPESIRQRQMDEYGEQLPKAIPAGPDNPLGSYAFKLDADSYLIHGTNKGVGIGMRVSHGCIRLYNWDIKQMMSLVPDNTPVKIINQSVKLAVDDGKLWMEVHAEADVTEQKLREEYTYQLLKLQSTGVSVMVDEEKVTKALAELSGLPSPIGELQPSLAASMSSGS